MQLNIRHVNIIIQCFIILQLIMVMNCEEQLYYVKLHKLMFKIVMISLNSIILYKHLKYIGNNYIAAVLDSRAGII